METQPILIYQKNVDKTLNRILMPKKVIEMFGRKFYMKVYPDKIVLPIDVKVTKEFLNEAPYRVVNVTNILDDEMGLDLGDETIKCFNSILETAKVVFWNGPLGVYEFSNFAEGTKKVLEKASVIPAKVILGGGDIVAASTELGYKDKVTHASTGGGATLEYIEGKQLPGIVAIDDLV